MRLLLEEDREKGPLGDDRAYVMVDHPSELLVRGQAIRTNARQSLLEERHRTVEDAGQQLLLRAEIAIDGGLGHPDIAGDLLERGGPVPANPEAIGGGAEDLRLKQAAPQRPAGASLHRHVTSVMTGDAVERCAGAAAGVLPLMALHAPAHG